jgi:glucokinase
VVVFVGTGLGGGIVSGGRMLTGCTNMAGELGHVTIVANGRPCRCRNRGCFEAYVGGWAIAERAREAIAADPDAGAVLVERAGGIDRVTAEIVQEAHDAGDPLASRLVDETAEYLGAGLVGVVNGFNPCTLVLGGGVIQNAPLYVDRAREIVSERALTAGVRRLKVVPAALGGEAGVIGAAAFARDRLSGKGIE